MYKLYRGEYKIKIRVSRVSLAKNKIEPKSKPPKISKAAAGLLKIEIGKSIGKSFEANNIGSKSIAYK